MWLVRILTSVHENFGLWLMGLLIAEGLFAFVMMFMFPLASIAMVFLGLISIGLAVVVKMVLSWTISLLCRLLGVEPPSPAEPTNPAPA